MSIENAKEFAKTVIATPELLNTVKSFSHNSPAVIANKLSKLSQDNGFQCSPEEAAYVASTVMIPSSSDINGELNDDDLEMIAGGKNDSIQIQSI